LPNFKAACLLVAVLVLAHASICGSSGPEAFVGAADVHGAPAGFTFSIVGERKMKHEQPNDLPIIGSADSIFSAALFVACNEVRFGSDRVPSTSQSSN
jgi:hypothetical protein